MGRSEDRHRYEMTACRSIVFDCFATGFRSGLGLVSRPAKLRSYIQDEHGRLSFENARESFFGCEGTITESISVNAISPFRAKHLDSIRSVKLGLYAPRRASR